MASKIKASAVPLSEDQKRFHADWTADDCIAELQRVAAIDPERPITRNFFRVHSKISEATWNRYFGSFLEFRRQAGLILSRHAHRLERDIAKHASRDQMRSMMVDKTSWEGKYQRPSKSRFKTILNASDLHDKLCDPFYRRLLIEAARRAQPEKIVLGGDIFDLPGFSRYVQDPREYDPKGRIEWVQALLRDLREAAPNAEIDLIEGNHEFRLIRHMTESTPALVTVLADLHGMTIPDLLGLTKYEVNYVARMDLATFTERDITKELRKNYLIVWDAVLFHHFPDAFNMGYPGANGHHHKHTVRPNFSPSFGSYEWHQTGAGHRKEANYCSAEKWSNGFLFAHVDTHTKRTVFEYVDVRDFAIIGGTFYTRLSSERFTSEAM